MDAPCSCCVVMGNQPPENAEKLFLASTSNHLFFLVLHCFRNTTRDLRIFLTPTANFHPLQEAMISSLLFVARRAPLWRPPPSAVMTLERSAERNSISLRRPTNHAKARFKHTQRSAPVDPRIEARLQKLERSFRWWKLGGVTATILLGGCMGNVQSQLDDVKYIFRGFDKGV